MSHWSLFVTPSIHCFFHIPINLLPLAIPDLGNAFLVRRRCVRSRALLERKQIGPRLETPTVGDPYIRPRPPIRDTQHDGTPGSQIWRSSGTLTFARHPVQARTDTPSFQEPGSKLGPPHRITRILHQLQSVKFYSSRNAPTTPCTPSRAPNVPGPKLPLLAIDILGLEDVTPIFASFLHLTLA
jgi:hypothetical protein